MLLPSGQFLDVLSNTSYKPLLYKHQPKFRLKKSNYFEILSRFLRILQEFRCHLLIPTGKVEAIQRDYSARALLLYSLNFVRSRGQWNTPRILRIKAASFAYCQCLLRDKKGFCFAAADLKTYVKSYRLVHNVDYKRQNSLDVTHALSPIPL